MTQCRNGNVNYKTEIYAGDEHLARAFKVSKSSSLLWREMVHGIDFLKFQRSLQKYPCMDCWRYICSAVKGYVWMGELRYICSALPKSLHSTLTIGSIRWRGEAWITVTITLSVDSTDDNRLTQTQLCPRNITEMPGSQPVRTVVNNLGAEICRSIEEFLSFFYSGKYWASLTHQDIVLCVLDMCNIICICLSICICVRILM